MRLTAHCIVAVYPGTRFDLGTRLVRQLAHLCRNQAGQAFAIAVELVGQCTEQGPTFVVPTLCAGGSATVGPAHDPVKSRIVVGRGMPMTSAVTGFADSKDVTGSATGTSMDQ